MIHHSDSKKLSKNINFLEKMEFVAFGEGEGEVTEQGDNGLGQMSEKVQAMAQSVYIELEIMVRKFGQESAQGGFKVSSDKFLQ
jgi:hypothetical protein